MGFLEFKSFRVGFRFWVAGLEARVLRFQGSGSPSSGLPSMNLK